MTSKKPVLPELAHLGEREREIYAFILDNWPTSTIEIAAQFNEDLTDREKQRRASTKYAYYVKKLILKKLLLSKKAGNSIIVWPLVVEKYRTIHNILKHHEPEHLAAMNKSKTQAQEPEHNHKDEYESDYTIKKAAKTLGVQ